MAMRGRFLLTNNERDHSSSQNWLLRMGLGIFFIKIAMFYHDHVSTDILNEVQQ